MWEQTQNEVLQLSGSYLILKIFSGPKATHFWSFAYLEISDFVVVLDKN